MVVAATLRASSVVSVVSTMTGRPKLRSLRVFCSSFFFFFLLLAGKLHACGADVDSRHVQLAEQLRLVSWVSGTSLAGGGALLNSRPYPPLEGSSSEGGGPTPPPRR